VSLDRIGSALQLLIFRGGGAFTLLYIGFSDTDPLNQRSSV
jgi:hypothetical protein